MTPSLSQRRSDRTVTLTLSEIELIFWEMCLTQDQAEAFWDRALRGTEGGPQ